MLPPTLPLTKETGSVESGNIHRDIVWTKFAAWLQAHWHKGKCYSQSVAMMDWSREEIDCLLTEVGDPTPPNGNEDHRMVQEAAGEDQVAAAGEIKSRLHAKKIKSRLQAKYLKSF